MSDQVPNFNLAARALRNASRLLLRDFLEIRVLRASIKGSATFAQRACERAEAAILEELIEVRPDYGFRCQHIADRAGKDPTRMWVINAADGFADYSHGLPQWCITAALVHKGVPVVAIVFDAFENEMFSALPGTGSRMNSTRIRTSNRAHLSEFTVSTEVGAGAGFSDAQFQRLQYVVKSVENTRANGSASLNIAHVCAGRLDAFWCEHFTPKSLPAARLLLTEAGGLCEAICVDGTSHHGIIAAGNVGFSAFAELIRNGQTRVD